MRIQLRKFDEDDLAASVESDDEYQLQIPLMMTIALEIGEFLYLVWWYVAANRKPDLATEGANAIS